MIEKKIALIVPKAAPKPVWEQAIKRYLPHLDGKVYNDLTIFNHTDLQRGGEFPETFQTIKEKADAFVIARHRLSTVGRVRETLKTLKP